MNNLLVCSNAKHTLKRLNESAGSGRYILEGIFAELDKMNRNQRIYPKQEYLKHLQYLRDDIASGEPLLGELDHPEDRFEVKLEHVSHRIIDLWYDADKNVVMGKIELLNTPAGKLAQSLVDQGIPLHISSRAAGSVAGDNKVTIQQIYTYDLVCKPGFASAVLHTVNESAGHRFSKDTMNFLIESEKMQNNNIAQKFGFLNEEINISEMAATAALREEAQRILSGDNVNIKENDMTKPLFEDEEAKLNPGLADIQKEGKSDDKKSQMLVDDKEEDEVKDSDNTSDGESDSDDKKESEEGGVEILGVEAVFGEESEDEDADKDDSDDSDDKDDSDDSDDKDADDKDKDDDSVDEAGEEKDEDTEKKAEEANDLNAKTEEDLDKSVSAVADKIDALLKKIDDAAKKNDEDNAASESIMTTYPIAQSLTESNLVAFNSLSEQQKNKVVSYLQDNKISDPVMINESWKDGIDYTTANPVWLKFAPSLYKELFEQASQSMKANIAAMADMLVFESQQDVNVFWENTGILAAFENRVMNEAFVNSLPNIQETPAIEYGQELLESIVNISMNRYSR